MRDRGPDRVLLTADTVGGVWTWATELAAALSADGVEVMLATLGPEPSSAQKAEAMGIPGLQLRVGRFRLEWMEDPWQEVARSGEWLLGLESSFHPGIVHLNSLAHGALPWRTPVLLTAHSCVLSWWKAVRGRTAPPEWDRYRREVGASIRAAEIITAPSHAMMRSIQSNYIPAPARCYVIPNGRSAHKFGPAKKEPFVLAAGRLWDEAKNILALAETAPGLSWRVCLAGDSQTPDGARREFPGCRMLGRLSSPALAEWYGRAAIYALPARYEPFGLSVLEAALSGCALVLGDIESLRENWHDCAVFVPPDDSHRLHRAIDDLISNPDRRIALANAAAVRAREFTMKRMAQTYSGIYSGLAAQEHTLCAS